MEMEHINENLIKVLIGPEDLAERGIDFLDLIGDQQSIERFFYSILEEVDVDRHFQGSSAVTFQVMPNKDGLELYISRSEIDDLESYIQDRMNEYKNEVEHTVNDLETSTDDEEIANDSDTSDQDDDDSSEEADEVSSRKKPYIMAFYRLEDFLQMARDWQYPQVDGSLYFSNGHYYLTVNNDSPEVSDIMTFHAFTAMREFGEIVQTTQDVMGEYGHLIREEDAIAFFGANM